MNRHARELGLRHTHYANPIGLDEPGNYSSARDLAHLAIRLRAQRVRARDGEPRSRRRCTPATTRARSSTATSRCAPRRGSTASRPGTRRARARCSSARARATASRWSRSCSGEPSEAARVRDTLALLRYGLGRYRRVAPAARCDRAVARPKIRFRGDERLDLVPRRPVSLTVRARPAHDRARGRARRGRRADRARASASGRAQVALPRARGRPGPARRGALRAGRRAAAQGAPRTDASPDPYPPGHGRGSRRVPSAPPAPRATRARPRAPAPAHGHRPPT